MAVRRVLWVLLCLIAGGPCAFLALELIGIPVVVLVLAGLVIIGRRNHSLGETLLGFGVTYTIEVSRYAVSDLILAVQQRNPAIAFYFGTHLLVASGILLYGFWLLLAARTLGELAGGRSH